MNDKYRRILLFVLLGFDLFLSIGGLVGGISFITDKTGSGLQAELSWLEKSPVDDFLLPGIYIFIMYAILPLMSLLLLRYWNKKALLLNALVGFSLIPWVVYQFFVVPETIFIQYVMIATGAIICINSLVLFFARAED